MAARKGRKPRTAEEFGDTARMLRALVPPPQAQGVHAWTLAAIMAARDAQLLGQFAQPARMAEAMRTDDALFSAYSNRLAPQQCVGVELKGAGGRRGDAVAAEAEGQFGAHGSALSAATLADITGCRANHGVAVACIDWTPRDDGSRTDPLVRYWPIEFVRWDAVKRQLVTRTDPAAGGAWDEPITHGDGRWIVFGSHESLPWTQDACILPASMVWARHAYALRDWARASVSHGNAKVLGQLPEGMALQDGAGNLTSEAAALLRLLECFQTDNPVGILPAGAKAELVTNTSTAWQVWNELANNSSKAAARIYLGTDGMLGSQGGAPGVDIATLFGVATTKVQGDLACIERALFTGLIEPWTALNFGDSSLAPVRRYMMPDADADAERASRATRLDAFFAHVEKLRAGGFVVDQAAVDAAADLHGVPAPALSAPLPAPEPGASASPPALRVVEPPREDVRADQEHAAKMHRALLEDIEDLRALGREPSERQVQTLARLYGAPPPPARSA